jgi:hypothetical protein
VRGVRPYREPRTLSRREFESWIRFNTSPATGVCAHWNLDPMREPGKLIAYGGVHFYAVCAPCGSGHGNAGIPVFDVEQVLKMWEPGRWIRHGFGLDLLR